MIKQLTDEIIHDINAILTAATILEETLEKRAPDHNKKGEVIPSRNVAESVNSAVSRLIGTNVAYDLYYE